MSLLTWMSSEEKCSQNTDWTMSYMMHDFSTTKEKGLQVKNEKKKLYPNSDPASHPDSWFLPLKVLIKTLLVESISFKSDKAKHNFLTHLMKNQGPTGFSLGKLGWRAEVKSLKPDLALLSSVDFMVRPPREERCFGADIILLACSSGWKSKSDYLDPTLYPEELCMWCS